ncbi:hypothetical protein [Nonomuraea sp. NPDC049758]|uniref:hypothetical protein n=1 Tax=Nonomuraea sp. NPDC049758 TaxID=3154360 RepID=UPI00342930F9
MAVSASVVATFVIRFGGELASPSPPLLLKPQVSLMCTLYPFQNTSALAAQRTSRSCAPAGQHAFDAGAVTPTEPAMQASGAASPMR